jgi:hypothetical protein
MTMPNNTTLLSHIVPTSNNVTPSSFIVVRSPEQKRTPAHSVTRKMFEPAVFAITIPDSPRWEEKIETSFSGSVVAKERSVTPRREEDKENAEESVLAEDVA